MSANEEYDIFLKRYSQVVSMHEMRFDTSRKLSSDYATLGLRTLSVLNGGAILAVPALTEIFQISESARELAAVSIETFAYGLIATAISILLAYISLEFDCAAIARKSEAETNQVVLDYLKGANAPNIDTEDKEQKIKELKCKRSRHRRISVFSQIIAIITALSGLGLFISGALNARAMFMV